MKINFFFKKQFLLSPYFILPFLVLITGIYSAPFNFDFHHSGLMLQTALDILDGKVIFKETYSQYGILTPYLHAFALKIFNAGYLSLQYITVFSYVVISILALQIWKKISHRISVLWIASFLFFIFQPYFQFELLSWPSVYAMVTQLFALYLFILFLETKKLSFIFFAGFFAALTYGFRWPVGILTLISFFIWFAFEFRRLQLKSLLVFLLGCLLFFMPCFAYLSYYDAILDMNRQIFQVPLAWVSGQRSPSPLTPLYNLFPLLQRIEFNNFLFILINLLAFLFWKASTYRKKYPRQSSILLCIFILLLVYFVLRSGIIRDEVAWTIIPLINLIAVFKIFYKRFFLKTKVDPILLIIIILGTSMWAQYHPVSEPRHYFWSATIMFGFTANFFDQFFKFVRQNLNFNFPARYINTKQVVLCSLALLCLLSLANEVNKNSKKVLKKLNRSSEAYKKLSHPQLLKGVLVPKVIFQKNQDLIRHFNLISKDQKVIYLFQDSGNAFYRRSDFHFPAFPQWPEISLIYNNKMKEQLTYIQKNTPLIYTDRERINKTYLHELPCYKVTLRIHDIFQLKNICN